MFLPTKVLLQVAVLSTTLNICFGVIIVPTPTLRVTNATTSTISISWTMPINEDNDNFTVKVAPADGSLIGIQIIDMTRSQYSIENLKPGMLYNISVTAHRGQLSSDPDTILQDTVPLAPINLELSCFDELILTLEGPFFADTQFSVEVHGIEAKWQKPQEGKSECFDAEIQPNHGRIALPSSNTEEQPGSTIRQFIQLTPGTTYTVSIYSSTCGEGSLGRLRSDPITKSLLLKPDSPGPITIKSLTSTSVNLDWSEEVLQGTYDNFELIFLNGTNLQNVLVDLPQDATQTNRDISGLQPCSEYRLQLYTLYKGSRSKRSQLIIVRTPPSPPSNFRASQIEETSFMLNWDIQGNTDNIQSKVLILDVDETFIVNEKLLQVVKLLPGGVYNTQLTTICSQRQETQSKAISIKVTTKPSLPQSVKVSCVPNSPLLRSTSKILVKWESSSVNIDGFVVDYSPYKFYNDNYELPVSLSSATREANITVPSGRVFTVYLRSISNNFLSDAVVGHAVCDHFTKKVITHCRTSALIWNIVIIAVNDSADLLIKIPNHPMHNATIVLPDRQIVTKEHTILIDNPCKDSFSSKIFVFPVCDNPESCFVVSRRLCTFERRLQLSQNYCCSEQLYNPQRAQCCHAQLQDKRKNLECCYTKWYDSSRQKCCGLKDNQGIVQAYNTICV